MEIVWNNAGWISCPVCGMPLKPGSGNTVACEKRHSYDLSSSGALNLLRGKPPEDYGARMLESRLLVCKAGFFDSLLKAVSSLLFQHAKTTNLRLLDAGCGEGSHLMAVRERLEAEGIPVSAIGLDISKDAIRIAARENEGPLWLVADLARLPLMDQSTGAILNILSPIHYGEFSRVLCDDGLVVKAMPGGEYLKELRQALYAGEDRERYTNDAVVSLFEQRFRVVASEHVRLQFPVPESLWPHIVAMTPLAWDAEETKRAEALAAPPQSVTLDFLVMAGRKKMT